MQVVTWNINGIRSISAKGFKNWFVRHSPDIIALQEIKAQKNDITKLLEEWSEYYDIYLNSAQKKGYSGVALLIKKKKSNELIAVKNGLGIEKFDIEGRLIVAEFSDFFLLNGYFPNGQRDHNRVPYKLEFSNEVLKLSKKLLKKNKGVIICGDLNTAHTEIDLANPKSNSETTGFLPIERAYIDTLIKSGFIDIFRLKYPNKTQEYTWWTYRGDCRERNIGWRLDYFFADKNFAPKIKKIIHHQDILGSDHCPVEIIF